MDYNPLRPSTLPKFLHEQDSFIFKAWALSCLHMGMIGKPKNDGYAGAMLAAIRTLSYADDGSFTWGHFKQGYKIIHVWADEGRLTHTLWEI